MGAAVTREHAEQVFVSREAAARIITVSTRTIDDAIRSGRLQAYKVGRRVLIRRDTLIRFAERVNCLVQVVIAQQG